MANKRQDMKKIMFDDRYGLTRAVLEGRKTNTRRQEKALDKEVQKFEETYKVPFSIVGQYYDVGFLFGKERLVIRTQKEVIYVKPHFKVGEVVAVAQNYNEVFDEFATIVYTQDKPVPDNFKAFGSNSDVTLPRTMPGWNNKMFVRADLMPHQIRITNVRVERLQDISDEDCRREGISKSSAPGQYYVDGLQRPRHNDGVLRSFTSPRDAFAALIDKISGKGTWKSNSFVFVYEFELLK